MVENIQAYFVMLENLSSQELDRSAQAIAAHEKHDIARFVAHIAEIGSRGFHLKLGYRSLFEYCVKRFNLTEGSVYRRTQVAGICRRFPQILEAISQGRLHLTGASLIAPHLADDTVERLIAAAQGKSKRELEKLLVTLSPKKLFVPSIRKQPARDPALPAPELGVPAMPQERLEVAALERGVTEATPTVLASVKGTNDLLQPATEDRSNVRFSAGSAFTEKLTRLAEVMGVERPQDHLEEILTRALEIALEKKDPQRKLERRRERDARKESPRPGEAEEDQRSCSCEEETRKEAETSSTEPADSAPSRHVPAAVRERVLERAGYRCEFRGPDGTRCSSRTGLQVEHTLPFAVYRTHEEKHLRAFCPAHNLLAARVFYGREFIQEKIDAARGENVERCAASAVP
jgi:hypothetical protein